MVDRQDGAALHAHSRSRAPGAGRRRIADAGGRQLRAPSLLYFPIFAFRRSTASAVAFASFVGCQPWAVLPLGICVAVALSPCPVNAVAFSCSTVTLISDMVITSSEIKVTVEHEKATAFTGQGERATATHIPSGKTAQGWHPKNEAKATAEAVDRLNAKIGK